MRQASRAWVLYAGGSRGDTGEEGDGVEAPGRGTEGEEGEEGGGDPLAGDKEASTEECGQQEAEPQPDG